MAREVCVPGVAVRWLGCGRMRNGEGEGEGVGRLDVWGVLRCQGTVGMRCGGRKCGLGSVGGCRGLGRGVGDVVEVEGVGGRWRGGRQGGRVGEREGGKEGEEQQAGGDTMRSENVQTPLRDRTTFIQRSKVRYPMRLFNTDYPTHPTAELLYPSSLVSPFCIPAYKGRDT